jgi:ankyrin repeat protein
MDAGKAIIVAAMAAALCCLGCEEPTRYPTLHDAAAAGDTEEVQRLIRHGVDIDALDNHGESALHHAVKYNQPAVAVLLIREGADIDPQTTQGADTPLHYAVMWENRSMVERLLRNGAQQDMTNADGLTPRAYTVQQSTVEAYDAAVRRSRAEPAPTEAPDGTTTPSR